MSVAFRRESDEEHREPRFELPIPTGPNLVTSAGLAQIQVRVAQLEGRFGAEQDEMRREEAARDLRYWRTRHATAQLAPAPPPDEVAFGSRVTIRYKGALRTIDVVGHDEADPAAGRLAFTAPLAQALIGGAVGDKVDFAGVKDAIEIVEVGAIAG